MGVLRLPRDGAKAIFRPIYRSTGAATRNKVRGGAACFVSRADRVERRIALAAGALAAAALSILSEAQRRHLQADIRGLTGSFLARAGRDTRPRRDPLIVRLEAKAELVVRHHQIAVAVTRH